VGRENNGGGNLTKIYCKHTCKCHNVLPVQLLYANKIIFFNSGKKVRIIKKESILV
jgi:hypothetical protein